MPFNIFSLRNLILKGFRRIVLDLCMLINRMNLTQEIRFQLVVSHDDGAVEYLCLELYGIDCRLYHTLYGLMDGLLLFRVK